MKRNVHYVINKDTMSEEKSVVRKALKNGANVTKVVRVEYQTGPTKAIFATITEITKPSEV